MPKVTEKYKLGKKIMLIDCAIEVVKRKPLYEMSMLDVINEAKISKGGIYLYFNDIDQLIIETINKIADDYESFQDYPHAELIDNDIPKTILNAFVNLGSFIESSPGLLAKIQFELMVYISNNPEKQQIILPNLKLKSFGQQFMDDISNFINIGIEDGAIRDGIDLALLMQNISMFIDGVVNRTVFSKVYHGDLLEYHLEDIFEQFAKMIVQYILK
ncbi:TetR/AcrR family transcriptional regulator [Paludicola sp. MB14-C6]|uniref:TetR/AcrR family transcriptional regulator n=1 Tax=Paludihabitans sp. MB14-C6 TaxID=3070656 RepID=UPI0027DE0424|nr:TetR/AcrR family transcriptional regulator [Paludicola sp. MB14-C6]WMJ22385.1 TetR/AcrR family transcriptional regulator [Paludicola sp. MB14-C6]